MVFVEVQINTFPEGGLSFSIYTVKDYITRGPAHYVKHIKRREKKKSDIIAGEKFRLK